MSVLAELLGNVALYFSWAVLGVLVIAGSHRHRVAMERVRRHDAAVAARYSGRSSLERPPRYRTAA